MTFDPPAIEPDVDELHQEDLSAEAVLVKPVGPIGVHELPARVAHTRNITVSDTTNPPEQVANEDLRRKSLTIICTGVPIFVAHDKQAAIDGTAGILPVGVALTLPVGVPVWVRAAAVGDAVVSYWSGNWAD